MGTAYSAIRTRVLRALRDPNAVTWDNDSEIYFEVSNAERKVARLLGDLRGSGMFAVTDTISLSANATSTNISALSSAATKEFVGVRFMEKLSTDNKRIPVERIPEGDEHIWRGSTTTVTSSDRAPGYTIRADAFLWLPVINAAQTIYCTYQWVPVVKTTGSDTLDTQTGVDDFIVKTAADELLAAEGERERQFEEFLVERWARIEDEYCDRTNRGLTDTVKNVSTRVLFG